MTTYTTAQVADSLGCSRKKVHALATQLGVGWDMGGRLGFKFNEDDVQKMLDSMRITPNEEGAA